MRARILTITGPPGAVDRSHGVAAATLVKSFQRMEGFLGGVILVGDDPSCARTIGFWEDDIAVGSSDRRAETMGTKLAEAIFGSHGAHDIQSFEVIAIDPPPALPFPRTDVS